MMQARHLVFICLLALAVDVSIYAAPEKVRVATYNIRNYLTMDRLIDGKFRRDYPKPEAEKAEVRKSILEAAPDLLAIQEIGSVAELQELRDDLEREGLGYDSLYVLEADDDTRRVGALWKSRLDITPVEHVDLGFTLFDEPFLVKRGMLELEVDAGEGARFSVFVLHLKSKYTSDRRDLQSVARRTKEAHAARERILQVFPSPVAERFLIVGDLNDHRNSGPVRRFLTRGDLQISEILPAEDSSGLIWTHYYKKGGEYSLLDYMLASPGLLKAASIESEIVDRTNYYEGSDHRLVWSDLYFSGRN